MRGRRSLLLMSEGFSSPWEPELVGFRSWLAGGCARRARGRAMGGKQTGEVRGIFCSGFPEESRAC